MNGCDISASKNPTAVRRKINGQAENLRRFHRSFSIVQRSFVIAVAAPFHDDK
jgi:hypothetical protein